MRSPPSARCSLPFPTPGIGKRCAAAGSSSPNALPGVAPNLPGGMAMGLRVHRPFAPCRLGVATVELASAFRIGFGSKASSDRGSSDKCPRGRPGQSPGLSHLTSCSPRRSTQPQGSLATLRRMAPGLPEVSEARSSKELAAPANGEAIPSHPPRRKLSKRSVAGLPF